MLISLNEKYLKVSDFKSLSEYYPLCANIIDLLCEYSNDSARIAAIRTLSMCVSFCYKNSHTVIRIVIKIAIEAAIRTPIETAGDSRGGFSYGGSYVDCYR